jgi:2-isopropylmalate synthase
MWEIFSAEYLEPDVPLRLNSVHSSSAHGEKDVLSAAIYHQGERLVLDGRGTGPIDAFVKSLGEIGYDVRVLDYHEHAMSAGGDARAAAYVECAVADEVLWGVGIDANIVTASLRAVVSAVNRTARPARQ